MQNQIIVVFTLFLVFPIKAQTGFEKVIIDVPGQNIPISVIEMDNGFIVCARGYVDIWPSIKLYRTDSVGNVIWFKFLGNDSVKAYSGGNIGSFKKAYDNSFILGGSVGSYGQNQRKMLSVKFDTLGNVIWSQTYGPITGYSKANQIIETHDGGICLDWEYQ